MTEDKVAVEAIKVAYEPEFVNRKFIRDLIKAAQDRGQEEVVLKHLAGALLHLMFPGATADKPTVPAAEGAVPLGDYLVGDTVFHVIVTPVMPVFDHCRENLAQGFQVFLLVTDKYFCGTRQNAEIILPGQVMVASVESLICQGLERLAGFWKKQMGRAIRQLLETYNQRIASLETDPSLRVEIPGNLE
jgi:hypothetical protein